MLCCWSVSGSVLGLPSGPLYAGARIEFGSDGSGRKFDSGMDTAS